MVRPRILPPRFNKSWLRRAAAPAMLGLSLGAAPPVLADPYRLQPGVEILRYDFDVTLGRDVDAITVEETIQLAPVGKRTETLVLDLCGKAAAVPTDARAADACVRAPSSHGPKVDPRIAMAPGMAITAVLIDGKAARFKQSSNSVTIDLGAIRGGTSPARVVLRYGGTPRAGLFIGYGRNGGRYFATAPWPDLNHHWLALVDHISTKTPMSMTVTAPAEFQVISNGLLSRQVDLPGGLRRTTWVQDVPIPAWQFSLVASRYAVNRLGSFRGVELTAWTLPEDEATAAPAFERMTMPILSYFSDRIGPYPYAKLAQIQAPMPGGGLELASNILYGFDGTPDRAIMAHELAHQWFGNAVTEANWDEVWLSEGFATYFALLYLEHADGADAFAVALRRSAKQAVDFALAHPGSTIVHHDLAAVSRVIVNQPQVYQGGAQVLHMLRRLVGEDVFWQGIRLYYGRFRNRHGTTADLRRAFEEACAAARSCGAEGRDLGWFFDQWLRRGDLPRIAGQWSYDPAAKSVRVTLEQVQAGAPFRLPIEIALSRGTANVADGAARRVMMDVRRLAFDIPAESEPAGLVFDPRQALTLATVQLDRAPPR